MNELSKTDKWVCVGFVTFWAVIVFITIKSLVGVTLTGLLTWLSV